MKKKLLIILTVLILLTGKVDALTLTQKLGSEYIETSVEKDEVVNMKFTSKVGFQFKNWVVSGVTGIDTTNPNISFSMPNNNVTIEGKYDSKYIVTFNNNTGTGSMTNLEIPAGGSKNLTKNTFTKDSYIFKGWSETVDGDVKYDDEANIKPTKNTTLYAVWEEDSRVVISLEDLPIGAYIAYNPVGEVVVKKEDSGTLGDQKFNTASNPYTGGWQVMYKDNGKITLISADSVGNLYLGKSGSATDDEINSALSGGKTGYAKAIYTLNEMCRDFATGEFAVREESRCLGYNGTAIENIFNYTKDADGDGKMDADLDGDGKIDKYDITHANLRTLLGLQTGVNIIKEPWGDSYNKTETDLVFNADNNLKCNTTVWLASRRLHSTSDVSSFYVRTLDSSGSVNGGRMYYRNSSGGSRGDGYSFGVRALIVLESEIKVIGCEGKDGLTADTAYILTK